MGGLYSHTTRATGLVLTAAIYNADHQNHIDNLTPAMIDDQSANVAAMQATTNPGGVGTESLATSLQGELERLRYVIKVLHGGAQWYPGAALPTLAGTNTWTGAQTIQALLDIQQALRVSGDISPTQLTANTDDWNPTGLSTASVIRASTDAARNITGLQGGADGRVILLLNIGSFSINLVHDATSTAANRFLCPNGATLNLTANSAAWLVYDSTSSRWRVISIDRISDTNGRVFIEAKNPSAAASIDFTTGITSTYDTYELVGHLIPATDDVQLWLRLDSNGGASFDAGASDYSHGSAGRVAITNANGGSIGDTQIQIVPDAGAGFAVGNAATEGVGFSIRIQRAANSSVYTIVGGTVWWVDPSSRGGSGTFGGARLAAQADNAIQLLFESGNIASGHVALFGVQRS